MSEWHCRLMGCCWEWKWALSCWEATGSLRHRRRQSRSRRRTQETVVCAHRETGLWTWLLAERGKNLVSIIRKHGDSVIHISNHMMKFDKSWKHDIEWRVAEKCVVRHPYLKFKNTLNNIPVMHAYLWGKTIKTWRRQGRISFWSAMSSGEIKGGKGEQKTKRAFYLARSPRMKYWDLSHLGSGWTSRVC